jgi:hypothetical protein
VVAVAEVEAEVASSVASASVVVASAFVYH